MARPGDRARTRHGCDVGPRRLRLRWPRERAGRAGGTLDGPPPAEGPGGAPADAASGGGAGNAGRGGADAAGATPHDEFVRELRRVTCDALVRCELMPDLVTCMTHHLTPRNRAEATLFASVASGRVRFDATAAAACLASISRWDCSEQGSRVVWGCAEAYRGDLGDGASCWHPAECRSGDCTSCKTSCCAGVCQAAPPAVADGQECNDEVWCTAESYCRFGGGGGICTPPLQEGAACSLSDECAGDLDCTASRLAPGVCSRLPRRGEPCTAGCRSAGANCDWSR